MIELILDRIKEFYKNNGIAPRYILASRDMVRTLEREVSDLGCLKTGENGYTFHGLGIIVVQGEDRLEIA